jgi:hypothetical protein
METPPTFDRPRTATHAVEGDRFMATARVRIQRGARWIRTHPYLLAERTMARPVSAGSAVNEVVARSYDEYY